MYVVSNAHLEWVEVVQRDRWHHGPLELIFVDMPAGRRRSPELDLALCNWNRHAQGGFARAADVLETVSTAVPGIEKVDNPNVILVPRIQGFTELHAMLASVLPDPTLRRARIKRERSNFWLWPVWRKNRGARSIASAFDSFIWERLTKGKRQRNGLGAKSSLRLLAGDATFWMSRLYRVAIERRQAFPEVDPEPTWRSLDALNTEFQKMVPEHDRFFLRRPLTGGWLWDPEDPDDRESVIREMLSGVGTMDSVLPVVEALQSRPTHEDFSDHYSWVKEDFERTFYSKRAKLRVTFLETIDDCPTRDGAETLGYENLLFRDLLAVCNVRERRLIIALRQGKTVSEIAREHNLRGHAAISRRIARLKARIRPLLIGS